MDKLCKNCNNIFIGRKERLFCSKDCYTIWSKGKRFGKGKPKNRKKNKCKVCKKIYEHWAGRESKYCSRECWSKRNPEILNQCLYCGKDFWDYKSNDKKYCCKKCYSFHQRELQKGSNSVFWKGGKTKLSKLARTRTVYLEWRNKVFERDSYTCQKCKIKSGCGHRVFLHAHHIKEFSLHTELRYEISNGITLCKNCHYQEHSHKF